MENKLDTSIEAIGARRYLTAPDEMPVLKRGRGRPILCDVDRLKRCAGLELTVAETARHLGIDASNVAYWAKKLGLTFTKKPRVYVPREPNPSFDLDRLRQCASDGMGMTEASLALNISLPMARYWAKKLNLAFVDKRGSGKRLHDPRSEAFLLRYQNGETLDEIGRSCWPPITRERVRQIMHKYHGTTQFDGGKHVRAMCNAAAREAAKDRKTLMRLGITREQWKIMLRANHEARERGLPVSDWPTRNFLQKRNNAQRTGVRWDLSPWEWWTIWQESGKWEQRGRGAGNYCMTRRDRNEAWTVENTIVAPFELATGPINKLINHGQ